MTCIGAALKAGNDVVVGCKVVDDLSFALIAPLEAENYINHDLELPVERQK